MTLTDFSGLLVVYLLSLALILTLGYREFRRERFNFNIFFTLIYLLTFYFGFPFTCILSFRFDVQTEPPEYLMYAMLASTAFYALYYVVYKTRIVRRQRQRPVLSMNRVETNLTWILLMLVA
ncbi:MAG: WzyE family oligosaccharide polymerase, partial [Plesiomonas shigelloides]